jgi:hypothetical protein
LGAFRLKTRYILVAKLTSHAMATLRATNLAVLKVCAESTLIWPDNSSLNFCSVSVYFAVARSGVAKVTSPCHS